MRKQDARKNVCIFLHGPPLWLHLTFDDPPHQPCSKIVTHPPIFSSPPPLLLYDQSLSKTLNFRKTVSWKEKRSSCLIVIGIHYINIMCEVNLYLWPDEQEQFTIKVVPLKWWFTVGLWTQPGIWQRLRNTSNSK